MKIRRVLMLIALTFLLSGCVEEQGSFETQDFESVIVSKNTYTHRVPVCTGKTTVMVTHHYYELYVMNPWSFEDPNLVYNVDETIYNSANVGDHCIVVAKLKDGKIIGTSLRGNKGLTGEGRIDG